jgi:hypothetical protein
MDLAAGAACCPQREFPAKSDRMETPIHQIPGVGRHQPTRSNHPDHFGYALRWIWDEENDQRHDDSIEALAFER